MCARTRACAPLRLATPGSMFILFLATSNFTNHFSIISSNRNATGIFYDNQVAPIFLFSFKVVIKIRVSDRDDVLRDIFF